MRVSNALLLLALALPLAACGDDGSPGADSGGGGDGGTSGNAPTITRVSWQQVAGCAGGTQSDVTVTVEVTDPDTDAAMLTFSGIVAGCTGQLDAATSTVTCPQAAPYASQVTVTDPEGHMDMKSFTIGVCDSSEVTF